MSEKLKPCPFCGDTNILKSSCSSGHGESTEYVYCQSCRVRMEDWFGKPEKLWNTRTQPTITVEDIAKVISECRLKRACYDINTAQEILNLIKGEA